MFPTLKASNKYPGMFVPYRDNRIWGLQPRDALASLDFPRLYKFVAVGDKSVRY